MRNALFWVEVESAVLNFCLKHFSFYEEMNEI
jgi:hypothetical protein